MGIVSSVNNINGDEAMAANRRLESDQDFQEAMERQARIRVFLNDQMVDSGGVITRFDDQVIALQASVSELTYHKRQLCEFFETRKR
jgi:hypothetical protein